MNKKRFILASLTAFVFVFAYDFLVHAILLTDAYEQTANLWRTKEGSQQYFHFMLLSQLAFAFAVAYAFTHYCKGGHLKEGIHFGFLLGLILASIDIATYCYMPIPLSLTLAWAAASLFKATGTGVVLGVVYKK